MKERDSVRFGETNVCGGHSVIGKVVQRKFKGSGLSLRTARCGTSTIKSKRESVSHLKKVGEGTGYLQNKRQIEKGVCFVRGNEKRR